MLLFSEDKGRSHHNQRSVLNNVIAIDNNIRKDTLCIPGSYTVLACNPVLL